MSRSSLLGFALALLSMLPAALPAPAAAPPAAAEASPPPAGSDPLDLPGLPNLVRLNDRLFTGGAPEGDVAFRSLKSWGVATIVSVDGEPPDAERAARFGMRAVHLPFGYDGCPRPTALALVRAIRDLPAPIYLHCHHGKHRAPTGAAFARIALDGLAPAAAAAEMRRAGTGEGYTGLYADVLQFRKPAKMELDRIPAEFSSSAPVPPMAASMLKISRRFAALRGAVDQGESMRAAGDALQFRELYIELARTAEAKRRPESFMRMLQADAQTAEKLEQALRAGRLQEAPLLLQTLSAGCRSCHALHRDRSPGRSAPVQDSAGS